MPADYYIDQTLCKQCKLCVAVCPVNMIGEDHDGKINFIPERESLCLECGQCMAVCSTQAVHVPTYDYARDFVKIPHKPAVELEQFTTFLAGRRSIRNYKSKPLPQDVIEQALTVLDYVPYGAAPEKTEVTVINNRKVIAGALPEMENFLDNIVTWVDNPIAAFMIRRKKGPELFNTIKNHLYPMARMENYKLKYGDRITRGAPAILLFHGDMSAEEHTNNALIYATYVMLALHAMGLGAAMNGIVSAATNKQPKLRKHFQIPTDHDVVISVLAGYPQYRYQRGVRRRNKQIHWPQFPQNT